MKRTIPIIEMSLLAVMFFMLTVSAIAQGGPDPKQSEEVLQNPALVYEKSFTVATTEAIWTKALDNPVMVGTLWNAYNFQPAYKVTPIPSGVHIVDPTGIIADILLIDSAGSNRRFYGEGSVNHWLIPSFFSARSIIQFQHRMEENRVHINLVVFAQGRNAVSNLVIRTFSGILNRHIGKRLASHIVDIQKITGDLAQSPEKAQQKLTGQALKDFNRLFMSQSP